MILVTGATGHVGKELVQQLLETDQPVRVLTRDARKVAYLGQRVECVVGDLSQPDTLAPAMAGVERVFLMALDTQQVRNALAAAQRAGVQHIVMLSTSEVNMPGMPIGEWHREREKLVEASGLAWTFLRPGMFMSNTPDWWGETIRRQGAVYFPGGKGKVAAIDPRDIAAVAAVALTQPGHAGKAYELTGPELLTIGEMVQIIGRVLDKRLRYVNIPIFVARFFMLRGGMNPVLVDALIKLIKAVRDGQGAQFTDTVSQLTGHPAHTFEEWVREHRAAFELKSA